MLLRSDKSDLPPTLPVRALALALALVALAASPGLAAPRQLDARDDPEVEGPLELQDKQCYEQVVRDRGSKVATVTGCIYLYTFDPLVDLDPFRDYGVLWLQGDVDTVPGWCTTELGMQLEIPPPARSHAGAPESSGAIRRRQGVHAQLDVSAGGRALARGMVAQHFVVYPKAMTVSGDQGEATTRLDWKGKISSTLGFALGREMSWPLFEPPQSLRAGFSNLRFLRAPSC